MVVLSELLRVRTWQEAREAEKEQLRRHTELSDRINGKGGDKDAQKGTPNSKSATAGRPQRGARLEDCKRTG